MDFYVSIIDNYYYFRKVKEQRDAISRPGLKKVVQQRMPLLTKMNHGAGVTWY
jgi:hypothetical protein